MSEKVKYNFLAFAKMAMHAMKYPHYTCCGFLLSPSQKDDDQETEIVDCVPITHTSHHLVPFIEIARNSTNAYVKDKNLSVVGYYYTDLPNDTFIQCVIDICPDALSCVVSFDDGGTPQVDTRRRKTSLECNIEHHGSIKKILYNRYKKFREVIDFDDHFDDISLDWTNSKLNDFISREGSTAEVVK